MISLTTSHCCRALMSGAEAVNWTGSDQWLQRPVSSMCARARDKFRPRSPPRPAGRPVAVKVPSSPLSSWRPHSKRGGSVAGAPGGFTCAMRYSIAAKAPPLSEKADDSNISMLVG